MNVDVATLSHNHTPTNCNTNTMVVDRRAATFIMFDAPGSVNSNKKTRVAPPVKRKQIKESDDRPILLQHCKNGHFREALERLASHPGEAEPVLLQTPPRVHPLPRTECFEVTALLLVCTARRIHNVTLWTELIYALVQVSPAQISAHCVLSHVATPLRALMEQHRVCTPDLLQLFLDTKEGVKEAYGDWDHSESPVSTLCMYLSKGQHPKSTVDLFRTWIDFYAKDQSRPSPAIASMLLSLGQCDAADQVIQVVQYSIEKDPSALQHKSKMTACNLLHLALRNFGYRLDLIQYLIEKDATLLSDPNVYGDLPLHVACTSGIGMPIWDMILSNTPRHLVWSTNKAGYTCVDLEWMRHMELGRSMAEGRIYLPLPAQAFPREARLEHTCRELLQQAVAQVVETDSPCKLGTVLHRIQKLVESAGDCSESCHDLLHAVSRLARLPGPCLAAPLTQLFQFLYPNQVMTRDKRGRLPLHHAVMMVPGSDVTHQVVAHSRIYDASDHQLWVEQMVQSCPGAAKCTDDSLHLPLHYALENNTPLLDQAAKAVLASNVLLLIKVFPESIHRRLPSTGLYPFQQAATNTNLEVETIFILLKRNPAVILHN